LVFTNCLQTLNFSMNFLLYCAVNSRFRTTIMDIVNCRNVFLENRGLSTRNGSRRATQYTFKSNSQKENSPNVQEMQEL
jgi:hypothetical protein